MSKMKYKILLPEENVIYKDDGNRLVLFFANQNDNSSTDIYHLYEHFIQTQLLDFLLSADYTNKGKDHIYKIIYDYIKEKLDVGPASDICDTLLSSLYVADCHTGKAVFIHNIEAPDAVIKWDTSSPGKIPFKGAVTQLNKKWTYSCVATIIGVFLGIIIAMIPNWTTHVDSPKTATNVNDNQNMPENVQKLKINAVYDPKSCAIYFSDTTYETIEYYIDYQKKVKSIDDINWKLQSNTLSSKDTMFLKDNCTVYLKGEKDETISEIQVINVSYYDFITELLVTQDPLIKSMLVTNSPTPFGNTTFLVDGIPQQVSYYKSSELIDFIKKGYHVTELKTIGSNLNPTNKRYPKLAKITIQK